MKEGRAGVMHGCGGREEQRGGRKEERGMVGGVGRSE